MLKIKKKIKSKGKLQKFFATNKLFTALIFIFIAGIILAHLILRNSEKTFFSKASEILTCHMKLRATGSSLYLFIESICTNLIFIVSIFLMGLSAWGIVLVPPVIFLKGYCSGLFQNCIYSSYGTKGIFFLVLIVLPGFLISILATSLLAKESIKISNIFSNMILNIPNWQSDEKYVRSYLLKTSCVLILIVLSAILDVIFNSLFYRFFSF